MALHNPGDPAYRAKKGNLFSTYLSATDPEKPGTHNDPTGRRTEKKIEKLLERDRSAKAKFERSRRCAPSVGSSPGRPRLTLADTEKLARYVLNELTSAERNGFLERLTLRHGSPFRQIPRDASVAEQLKRLLTEEEAARYLNELMRRRRDGEPFIQAHA